MSQATESEPVTGTTSRGVWIAVAAIAAVAALVLGGFGWARHQQLSAAAASVPATMDLVGANRGEVVKQYRPLGYAPDASARITVEYTLEDADAALADADADAALADAEAQLAADGWRLVDRSSGDTTTMHFEKSGSGIEGVTISVEGEALWVSLTAEP